MKNSFPIAMRIVRSTGILFGLFILLGRFFAPKSNVESPTVVSIADDTILLCLGALLVIPWSKIKTPILWRVLFAVLAFCVLLFLAGQIGGCVWAFRNGEPFQQVMFTLLTAFFGVILLSQFQAIVRMKKKSNAE